MILSYQSAVVGLCDDLTNPNASTTPLAVAKSGTSRVHSGHDMSVISLLISGIVRTVAPGRPCNMLNSD